jgi:L-arabinose isomerase
MVRVFLRSFAVSILNPSNETSTSRRTFGIGLDTYWPQFKGLKPRLEGYVRTVQKKLERPGVEVVNLGLIDNPKKALEAGHNFARRMWT